MKASEIGCLAMAVLSFATIASGLRCYQTTKVESRQFVVDNEKKIQCKPDSSCLYMTSDTSTSVLGFELKGKMKLGMCVPKQNCTSLSCSSISTSTSLGSFNEALTLKNCKMSCCDSDLCNNEHVEEQTIPNVMDITLPPEGTTPITTIGDAVTTLAATNESATVEDFQGSGFIENRNCGNPARTAVVGVTQNLTSPGWPGNYKDNESCEWSFTAPIGHVIKFTVVSFKTETCCDIFKVYSPGERFPFEISGRVPHGFSRVTPLNEARITFTTDHIVTNEGFEIEYTAVPVSTTVETFTSNAEPAVNETAPGPVPVTSAPEPIPFTYHAMSTSSSEFSLCGPSNLSAVVGQNKSLTSPNYPNQYGNSIRCSWTIDAPVGHVIRFTVVSFQTETCCDFLKVYNPGETSSDQDFSGTLPKGEEYTTFQNQIRLVFSSDALVSKSGFEVYFTAVLAPTAATTSSTKSLSEDAQCGSSVRVASVDVESTLTSPGWPSNYKKNENCSWTITAPKSYVIRFRIESFTTEVCCDFVKVYIPGKREPIQRLSGAIPAGTTFKSTSNEIQLTFTSDSSFSYAGFSVTYKAVYDQGIDSTTIPETSISTTTLAPCGFNAIADLTSQNLTSPGYPSYYLNSLDCVWTLTALPGYQIRLKFHEVLTEACCDFVKVFDSNGQTNQVGKLSGEQVDKTFESTNGTLTVSFHSDIATNNWGFRASFVAFLSSDAVTSPMTPQELRTTSAGPLQCYNLQKITYSSSMIPPTNSRRVVDCPTQSCMLVTAESAITVGPLSVTANFTIGMCAPTASCEQLDCNSLSQLGFSSVPGMTLRKCQTQCCDTELCNGVEEAQTQTSAPSVSIPPTTVKTSPLQCYNLQKITYSSPMIPPTNSRRVVDCPGQSCMLITAESAISMGPISVTANFTIGMCAPTASCEQMDCNSISQLGFSSVPGMTLSNCQTQCCDTELCNGVEEAPTQTSTPAVPIPPTTVKTSPLQCYNIQKIDYSESWIPASNRRRVVDCPGQSCMLLRARSDISSIVSASIDANLTIGMCVPTTSCRQVTCSMLSSLIPNLTNIGISLDDCKISCCDTDLCNGDDEDLARTTLPQTTTTTPVMETTADKPDGCGNEDLTALVNKSQTIQTPGYSSGQYPALTSCEWEIKVPPGHRLIIQFTDFKTEECCDRLSIFNATAGDRSEFLYGFSGPRTPADLSIDAKEVALRFNSDRSLQYEGFSLQFFAFDPNQNYTPPVLKTTFCVTDDVFVTPGFDVSVKTRGITYNSNRDCWMVVRTAPGFLIRLRFDLFDTELCCDGLRVYNSSSREESSDLLIAQLKGDFADPKTGTVKTVYSRTNHLSMIFFSDGSLTKKGISGTMSAVRQEEVVTAPPTTGDVLTATTSSETQTSTEHCGFNTDASFSPRILTTPNYPNDYPPNTRCSWTLRAMRGYQVKLTVYDGHSESCCDKLRVFDGHTSSFSLLGTILGALVSNVTFVSTDRHLTITFTTDNYISGIGFASSYVLVPDPTVQATTQAAAAAPDTTYAMASTPHSQSSPSISQSGCNRDLAAVYTDKYITSPNYPFPYNPRTQCTYRISAPNGSNIQIRFDDFWTEPCCDHVKISENGVQQESLSGMKHNEKYLSTTSNVVVTFTSDGTQQKKGFRMSFRIANETRLTTPSPAIQECDSITYAETTPKTIASPNYPQSYPNNANCRLTIRGQKGYTIAFNFTTFETEECCDFLKISSSSGSELTRFRGSRGHVTFVTNRSEVFLFFHSDGGLTKKGFFGTVKLVPDSSVAKPETTAIAATAPATNKYQEVTSAPTSTVNLMESPDCGETVQAFLKPRRISSPLWPYKYPARSNCSWSIVGQPGYVVRFNFSHFNTESCCDSLTFLNDYSRLQGNLGRYSLDVDSTFFSVRFKSDYIVERNGFTGTIYLVPRAEAAIYTTAGQTRAWATTTTTASPMTSSAPAIGRALGGSCGFDRSVFATPLTISSPDYPNDYPPNSNCSWTARAPTGMQVKLDFAVMAVETCCDQVTIYDGPDRRLLAANVGKVSNISAQVYRSTAGSLTVRFTSDSSLSYSGFAGSFLAIQDYVVPVDACGFTTTATSEWRTMTSPNYPNNYPRGVTCDWLIKASQTDGTIQISIDDINVESCCDKLKAYDGNSPQSPAISTRIVTPQNISSTGDALYLSFSSDKTLSRRGFTLRYRQVLPTTPSEFNYGDDDNLMTNLSSVDLEDVDIEIANLTSLYNFYGAVNLTDYGGKFINISAIYPDYGNTSTSGVINGDGGLYCHDGDRTTTENGEIVASDGGGAPCLSSQQCFEVSYRTSSGPAWIGKCMERSVCRNLTCDALSQIYRGLSVARSNPSGATFDNCTIRCCDTEYCNERLRDLSTDSGLPDYGDVVVNETSMVSGPDYGGMLVNISSIYPDYGSRPTGLNCRQGLTAVLEESAVFDNVAYLPRPCAPNEQCFEAAFRTDAGGAWTGGCMSRSNCSAINCQTLSSSFDRSRISVPVSFDGCSVRCCESDSCNNHYANISTASGSDYGNYGVNETMLSGPDYGGSFANISMVYPPDYGGSFANISMVYPPDYGPVPSSTVQVSATSTPGSGSATSEDDVPFLPGCTLREYFEKNFVCSTLFYNDYPYSDPAQCRSNLKYYLYCVQETLMRCQNGSKPTITDGLTTFVNIGKVMADSIMNMTSVVNPTNEALCSRDTSFLDSLMANLTQLGLGGAAAQGPVQICDLQKVVTGARELMPLIRTMATANTTQQFCNSYTAMLETAARMYTDVCNFKSLARFLPTLSRFYGNLQKMFDLLPKMLREYSDLPKCLALAYIERLPATTASSPPTTTAPQVTNDTNGCTKYNMDLMFVLDGSGSIRPYEFRQVLDFVKTIVDSVNLTENQVGVIQYSHYSSSRSLSQQQYIKTEIPLGRYTNNADFDKAIDGIKHIGYTTYTARAIQVAVQLGLAGSSRFTDPCTKKVIIVVTDGKSSDADLLRSTVSMANSYGVTLLAVGVRNFVITELQEIAGYNPKHIFTVTNFAGLNGPGLSVGNALSNILSPGNNSSRINP